MINIWFILTALAIPFLYYFLHKHATYKKVISPLYYFMTIIIVSVSVLVNNYSPVFLVLAILVSLFLIIRGLQVIVTFDDDGFSLNGKCLVPPQPGFRTVLFRDIVSIDVFSETEIKLFPGSKDDFKEIILKTKDGTMCIDMPFTMQTAFINNIRNKCKDVPGMNVFKIRGIVSLIADIVVSIGAIAFIFY